MSKMFSSFTMKCSSFWSPVHKIIIPFDCFCHYGRAAGIPLYFRKSHLNTTANRVQGPTVSVHDRQASKAIKLEGGHFMSRWTPGIHVHVATGTCLGCRHSHSTSSAGNRTAVIIGGGISGLTAAYYLTKAKRNPFHKIVLYESSDRVGGWINSLHLDDGTIFEQGPRTLRSPTATPAAKATIELAESLGLAEDIVAVTGKEPAAKNRYIFVNGKLHALPNSLPKLMSTQPPFTKPLGYYIMKERWVPTKLDSSDESVYDFFRRRFGEEIANYAVGALCRGIYASDAKLLSVKACFPSLFEAEKEYGSIVGSVIKGLFRSKKGKTEKENIDSTDLLVNSSKKGELLQRAKKERWSVWSLCKGLSQLPLALASELQQDPRVEFHLNTHCQGVHFEGPKVTVNTDMGKLEADHVFSSVYAKSLSPLLSGVDSRLTELLSSIPAVTVAVVNLEYDNLDFKMEGFGHLIPPIQPSNVIGVIYDSCSFPDRAAGARTIFTCMLGGSCFEEKFGDPDKVDPDQLTAQAISSLKDQLGISQQPCRTYIGIQKDCIPMYKVGHTDVVQEIFQHVKDTSLPLSLLGSSYKGVGVPDCIINAEQEVIRILKMHNSKSL